MKKQKTLKVEKFNKKGVGIAFDENHNKVLIPTALIQDEIFLELSKKRKGVIKANIISFIKKSSFRVEPKCSHFDLCGGCIWQNFEYSEQLKQKEKLVIDVFEDFVKNTNVKLFSIAPSVEIFKYRNKMEFSFSQNRKGTNYLGLMIRGGRKFVFDVEKCYLANSWFSDLLTEIKAWVEHFNFSAYNVMSSSGFLRTLTLKEAKNRKEKMVILTTDDSHILTKEEKEDFITKVIKITTKENVSIYWVVKKAEKGKPTTFEKSLLFGKDKITEDLYIDLKSKQVKLSFNIGPFSFFQPNTKQAQQLYSIALNYLDLDSLKDQVVLDLYSGTGTLGMILSLVSKKVIGIELNQESCVMAKENIKLNQINNFEFLQGDVKDVLENLLKDKDFEKPSTIVVDPPRSGLEKQAIENILKIMPQNILYISCNPTTQKDDIVTLTEKGYKLILIHPIDQFPHTYHIENIALLKRA